MKVAIVLASLFLLQVTYAFPKGVEVYEGLDGHMYTVEKGRNGEEKVSREDSKIKEISIALRKLGKWVILIENEKENCYVVDMKEDEITLKTKAKFETGTYEVKHLEGEEQAEIIETCERHGGKGRSIVHLGPKDNTMKTNSLNYLHGEHRGIVKRAFCWDVCYRLSTACSFMGCFVYMEPYMCLTWC